MVAKKKTKKVSTKAAAPRPKGRPATMRASCMVHFTMDPTTYAQLQKAADAAGESKSHVVRQALAKYFGRATRKPAAGTGRRPAGRRKQAPSP